MKSFVSTFNKTYRACDYYNCQSGKEKLFPYENDMGFSIRFCLYHKEHPYGDVSDIVPVFNIKSYLIYDDNGECLCNYVGCNESKNLKNLYKANWCTHHGRVITSLRLSVLNKSDKKMILDNKLKEFSYVKVLSTDLLNDIIILEKELGVNTDESLNLKINQIHYEYLLSNYKYINNTGMPDGCFTYFKKSHNEYFENLFKRRK